MIYLDANVIIRLLEGDAATRQMLTGKLQGKGPFMTSELALIECRCKPMKDGNQTVLAQYDQFFAAADLQLFAIDRAIVDQATQLRATTNLRVPDALHLATALRHQAKSFFSGDRHFANITLLPVELV